MKHIADWFRRNNTIMAQAKDSYRQLQEAWDEKSAQDVLLALQRIDIIELQKANYTITTQLHRVARERDNERELRLEAYSVCQDAMNQISAERNLRLDLEEHYEELLAEVRNRLIEAEVALLDYHLDKEPPVDQSAELEQLAEELRDTYLEELENEEE